MQNPVADLARHAALVGRVTCLVLLGLVGPAMGTHAQTQDDLLDVYWEFRHGSVVNTVVESRYDGETFYVSLGDLFGAVQIDLDQEVSEERATGFFLKTDHRYAIDFQAGSATSGETTIEFDTTAFIKGELGYYVRPELLERLFGIGIELDERQLVLRLTSEHEMPVVAAARRQFGRSRQTAFGMQHGEQIAPLLYDRRRALFDGGVLAYRLSTTITGTTPRAALSLRGGGEILGGDIEVGGYTSLSDAGNGASPLTFDLNTLRWRMVTDDSPVIRQVRLGKLSSTGLRTFSFSGVSLSNERANIQQFFGSYPVRVNSEPGWEIELYLNNQLVEVRRADAAGSQVFSVPITYGTSRLRIVEYGPNGEYEETERQIQVPFTFVPRGELRYTVDAGKSILDNRNLAQGSAAFGLTSALTAKIGAEYVSSSPPDALQSSVLLGYGQLSARLLGPYVATATYAPGHLFKASVSAYHASLLSYGLEFNRYYRDGIYNRSRNLHDLRANVSAPFRFGGVPVYLNATITERKIDSDRFAVNVNPDISFQPGAFRFNVGYRGAGTISAGEMVPTTESIDARIGYTFSRGDRIPAMLRGMLLSSRMVYDIERSEVQNLSLNLSRSISSSMRAQVDVSHYVPTASTQLSVRLLFTLPTLRASSGMQTQSSGNATFSQDISGAISYDPGEGNIEMMQHDWVGRSAATMRFFVDENGNGRRDEGETVIDHGGVNFRQAVRTRSHPGGIIVAYNLQAYEQYSVDVDQTKIRNPLWVPHFEEFSFITDPNQHKIVDIPFYVSGEVSGKALMHDENGERPIPGLKIQIRQIGGTVAKQQVVFGDGTFYTIGLPPGEYEARVDSSQLAILEASSEPAARTFTLRSTKTGDAVEGIDFVLRPLEAPPALSNAKSAAGGGVRKDAVSTVEATGPEETVQSTVDAGEPEGTLPETFDEPGRENAVESAAKGDDQTGARGAERERRYVVRRDDAGLMDIARNAYDKEGLWTKIWVANQDLLPDPDRVKAGMTLIIPPDAPLTPEEEAAKDAYYGR